VAGQGHGATNPEPQSKSEAINADMFKYVADKLVEEAASGPCCTPVAIDTIIEDGAVAGVIVHSKSGAGPSWPGGRRRLGRRRPDPLRGRARTTRRPEEKMLPVTVMFSVPASIGGGSSTTSSRTPPAYKDWGHEWDIQKGGKEGRALQPLPGEAVRAGAPAGGDPARAQDIGGTWSTITDSGRGHLPEHDPPDRLRRTDVWDLTRAEIEGRYQGLQAIKALNHFAPGFEKAKLRTYGMTVGVRDTRKIEGRYSLTEHDVRNEARFEDSIGIFPEFIDGYGVLVLPTTGRYYQIPYRALVPQRIRNLLVAGRCIAGDAISHASIRSMMCCAVTGQGAGAAAAVSIKDGVDAAEISVARLQAELKRQGVRLT
jgi:hypothetical protein